MGVFDDGPKEGGENACLSFRHLSIHYAYALYCQITKEGGREGGRGRMDLLEPGKEKGEELGRTLKGKASEEASRGVVMGDDMGEEEGGATEEGGGGGGGRGGGEERGRVLFDGWIPDRGGGGGGGGRRRGKENAGVFTEMS